MGRPGTKLTAMVLYDIASGVTCAACILVSECHWSVCVRTQKRGLLSGYYSFLQIFFFFFKVL